MLSRFLLYLRPQASVSESLSRSHFRISGKLACPAILPYTESARTTRLFLAVPGPR
jgi:hypothetical protein